MGGEIPKGGRAGRARSLGIWPRGGEIPGTPGQMGTRCVDSLSPCPVSPRYITSVSWPVLSLSLLSRDRWGQLGTRCVSSLSPCPKTCYSVSWSVLGLPLLSRDRWGQNLFIVIPLQCGQ